MPRGRPPQTRPSPASAADFFAVRTPPKRGRPCAEPPPPPADAPLAPLFVRIKRQLTPEEQRERLAREAAECERIVARMTADCAEVNPFFRARPAPTATAAAAAAGAGEQGSVGAPSAGGSDTPCRERDESPALVWPGRTHVHQTAGDPETLPAAEALPPGWVLSAEPDYAALLAHELEALPTAPTALPAPAAAVEEGEEGAGAGAEGETEWMDAEECFEAMDLVLRHKQGDTTATRAAYEEVVAAAAQHAGESLLWAEKYRPRSHQAVCGNAECFTQLSRWLGAWATGCSSSSSNSSKEDAGKSSNSDNSDDEDEEPQTRNLFVVQGAGCCCKTAGVFACAEEHGMEVIELNASEARSGKCVAQRTAEAAASQQLTPATAAAARSLRRVFLFEDVDVCLAGDTGLHAAILALAQTTSYPVVATCRAAPPDVARLCAHGRCARLAPPPAAAIAHRALLVLLCERGLLPPLPSSPASAPARAVPRARTTALVCAVRALAALLAPAAGLRGLTAALHLASTTARWAALTPATLAAAHLGLAPAAPTTDARALARALETAHGAACDVGFDSWPRWPATGDATALWRTADGFSVLDAAAAVAATPRRHRGTHLARVAACTGWRAPRQTLAAWSRLGVAACALEAALLTAGRADASACASACASECTWHVRASTVPGACYSARGHGDGDARMVPPPRLLNPRQLPGLWGGARPPPWQLLCNAARGPFTARWAADVLPALRAVCAAETTRRRAGTARRFVHHLGAATPPELAAVAASGLAGLAGTAGAAAAVRCDCCACPLLLRFLR